MRSNLPAVVFFILAHPALSGNRILFENEQIHFRAGYIRTGQGQFK
jgi:hypothetical protein